MLTDEELVDLLIKVSDSYNPYLIDEDLRTLYYAGADALTEVEKLASNQQLQFINAIVDYMWTPVACVD